MRPAGEIRSAMRKAALGLRARAKELGGLTYRDLAEAGQVGFDEARKVSKEMARAGELMPFGTRQVPGSRRPLTTYMPAANQPSLDDAVGQLAGVVGVWASAA
jgi:hypothetical protein